MRSSQRKAIHRGHKDQLGRKARRVLLARQVPTAQQAQQDLLVQPERKERKAIQDQPGQQDHKDSRGRTVRESRSWDH